MAFCSRSNKCHLPENLILNHSCPHLPVGNILQLPHIGEDVASQLEDTFSAGHSGEYVIALFLTIKIVVVLILHNPGPDHFLLAPALAGEIHEDLLRVEGELGREIDAGLEDEHLVLVARVEVDDLQIGVYPGGCFDVGDGEYREEKK